MFRACAGSRLSSPLRAAISQADLGQHGPLHNSSGQAGRPTAASSTEPLVLHQPAPQEHVRKSCAFTDKCESI